MQIRINTKPNLSIAILDTFEIISISYNFDKNFIDIVTYNHFIKLWFDSFNDTAEFCNLLIKHVKSINNQKMDKILYVDEINKMTIDTMMNFEIRK